MLALAYTHSTVPGEAQCAIANELCCDRTHSQFTPIWSLQHVNDTDYLVTTKLSESNHLQRLGTYRELCATSLGDYGTDLFCYTPGACPDDPKCAHSFCM